MALHYGRCLKAPIDFIDDFPITPALSVEDEYDTSTIREALKRAWDKPESLLLRDHLRRNLTWDHSAQQLVAAYERRLGSR